MNRQNQLELIITKEQAINKQMKTLKTLIHNIEEYRNFNNVFISSLRTFKEIKSNINLKSNQYGFISGSELEIEIYNKIQTVENNAINFINDRMNYFKEKSEKVVISNKEVAREYKYVQQIIDDYIKLLLYIE